MATAPGGIQKLPVGSVVEQRQGSRTFLVVQETSETATRIESWDDGSKLVNRLLGRLGKTLKEMNADISALNKRLEVGLRRTDAKIRANQRLLEQLVNGRP